MISWLDNLDTALQTAKKQSKLVFFDVFNPG